LEEKSLVFYHQALENPKWLSFQLIRFLQFQKERVSKGEIVESTISNYFKAIRLFCEMNEIDVNWKIIKKVCLQGDISLKIGLGQLMK
jgi:hypothetical protein